MCCGRTRSRNGRARGASPASTLIGAAGLVLLEYRGDEAAAVWYGNVTGARYVFGRRLRKRYVDKDDAPRLLAMTLDGSPALVEVAA